MSYRIEYSPHKDKIYPISKKRTLLPAFLIGIICFIFTFALFAADVSTAAQVWFETLDELAIQMKTGTRVGQAISAYCKEMVSNVVIG